jgi:hypothetical protein
MSGDCPNCYGAKGWFEHNGQRVFSVLEDRHGFHARHMRGSWKWCACASEEYDRDNCADYDVEGKYP